MKEKSSNYWLFLILGFLFIAIVTFVFLHYYLGLCVPQIFNDSGPNAANNRYNFWVDLMYIPGSLLVTAFLFYMAGRYFGGSSKKNYASGSNDLQTQLDECREQYADLLVKSSGGKIDQSAPKKSSPSEDARFSSTSFVEEPKSSSNLAASLKEEASKEDISELDRQLEAKRQELKSNSDVETPSGSENVSASAGLASSMSGSDDSASGAGTKDTSSASNFDGSKAKGVFGKAIKVDDLKLVEGIGPKIASILNQYNIHTWKDLANETPEKISEYLLKEGGAAYKIHDPSTWPKQAKLAAEGKFDELKDLQDNLKGGREV